MLHACREAPSHSDFSERGESFCHRAVLSAHPYFCAYTWGGPPSTLFCCLQGLSCLHHPMPFACQSRPQLPHDCGSSPPSLAVPSLKLFSPGWPDLTNLTRHFVTLSQVGPISSPWSSEWPSSHKSWNPIIDTSCKTECWLAGSIHSSSSSSFHWQVTPLGPGALGPHLQSHTVILAMLQVSPGHTAGSHVEEQQGGMGREPEKPWQPPHNVLHPNPWQAANLPKSWPRSGQQMGTSAPQQAASHCYHLPHPLSAVGLRCSQLGCFTKCSSQPHICYQGTETLLCADLQVGQNTLLGLKATGFQPFPSWSLHFPHLYAQTLPASSSTAGVQAFEATASQKSWHIPYCYRETWLSEVKHKAEKHCPRL